ncbi:PspA/IM30 family protein [Labrys wisconsinensis]|uniref:F0F1-type ATP synthase membrane subunit b/b n=1 Tax=Labrys wisconsinensis TaxID=425677 RepID=A0ABU0J8P1_9HYPH|nr:PspA/IM30 family protein [Labrys wisconsinensis]MDQ0469798.1 F0F1-type ATP synthase membrane subunit b/b' [Labrys wisconsinensis]
MARVRTLQSAALRYALFPDAEALAAIVETFRDYETMMAILAEVAADSSAGSNLVLLHEQAYGRVRAQTRLPAQMVVLGLRDFVARRNGEPVEGLPLDDKLYAIKGAASLTIATVAGRISVACDVRGYLPGWQGSIPARLVAEGDILEIRVGVTPRHLPNEEKTMIHEGILSRMGRLIAGFAHSSIDKAEGLDPAAVVEQAIREIDAAADEARAELGKAMAERHRIDSRRQEISTEIGTLQQRIATAIAQARDDLARSGIGRQVDLEAQIGALDKALADVDDRIDEGRKALQAVAAARKDAESRLADLRRSLAPQHNGGSPAGGPGAPSPVDKAARSASAIARVTGVPAGAPAADGGKLDELERLHRDNLIEERLVAIKARH